MAVRSLLWFRKGLRLADNPSLWDAISGTEEQAKEKKLWKHALFPVFVLDPHFVKPENVGSNRMQFLLESLQDLDK